MHNYNAVIYVTYCEFISEEDVISSRGQGNTILSKFTNQYKLMTENVYNSDEYNCDKTSKTVSNI